MDILVIGLGSMGRRRARLLHEIDPAIRIIGVDLQEERRKQAEKEPGIETRASIGEACSAFHPEAAIISTSPLSHASIITECLTRELHVFTELNLVNTDYEKNMDLAEKKGKVLFLSSTFLYRGEIQAIREEVVRSGCNLSYMYHAGQYLPDWHPWESYKNFFVGDKRTNGCREFMAIEFPWILDVFGEIRSITSMGRKDSTLEIDFPDTYQIMIEHVTGHRGMITIDIVSRKAVRRLEVSGENLYLTWNGTPESLYKYDYTEKRDIQIRPYESTVNREGYSAFIIEDAYKSELENFLGVMKEQEKPRYSFEKDKKILSVIDQIEINH